MISKNVFSSVFHSLPSHFIIKHILFAFHSSLESVVINYLYLICCYQLSISKNAFSSVFHSLTSHVIIQHILFAFHSSLESVVINYLFCYPNFGILKRVILLLLLSLKLLLPCEKKVLLSFFSKNGCHINFKFWPVITTTNKTFIIILWYSERINGYDKNLAHVKLLSLALKIG